MKRLTLLLIAVLAFALMPAVATAQTSEEKLAAVVALEEALDGVECVTVEGCIEDVAEVKAALAVLKEVLPDLDYGDLDAAIADLEAAIEGGDLDEIAAAAEAVAAAGAAVVAEGKAAAEEEDTTTTTIGEVVTDIPDGGSGPNVALLGAAALVVLLSGAALALRASADRR